MKETISLSVSIIPNYGEILLGMGKVIIDEREFLFDNQEARNNIIDYLVNKAPKRKNLLGVSLCNEFQKVAFKYLKRAVIFKVLKNTDDKNKIVNMKMVEFFQNVVWPIAVKHYINSLDVSAGFCRISLNVKKNVYMTIYEEDVPQRFITEFKSFLEYNYIIIPEYMIKENGDILVRLIIPNMSILNEE